MNVLITGASGGIGSATARKFLESGHRVIGVDIADATIFDAHYSHVKADVTAKDLPDLSDIEILVNCAGVQNTERDIEVNLGGAINVTEKYGFSPAVKSIVFIASASATTGSEFPSYAASKGGLLAYCKNTAIRIAKFGATANCISPGGVTTSLNDHVMSDPVLWKKIMKLTPLKKWASAQEIAEWVYFVSVVNRSMTGQNIIIDNGESSNFEFVW